MLCLDKEASLILQFNSNLNISIISFISNLIYIFIRMSLEERDSISTNKKAFFTVYTFNKQMKPILQSFPNLTVFLTNVK